MPENNLRSHIGVPAPVGAPMTLQNELRAALNLLRRRSRYLTVGAAMGALILGVYAFVATPVYRAMAQMLIDPKILFVLETTGERTNRGSEAPASDSARVDSVVEMLKSDQIALKVIKENKLQDDPEFYGEPSVLDKSLISSRGSLALATCQRGRTRPPTC